MTVTVHSRIPSSFVCGDTVKFLVPGGDCDPATWTLTAYFTNQNGQQTKTGTDNGDGNWLVNLTATDTGAFLDEESYRYHARANLAAEYVTVDFGRIYAKFDPAGVGGTFDYRSKCEQIVDSIKARLVNKATVDQLQVTIAGRSLTRYSPQELTEWLAYFENKLALEVRKERLAAGREARGRVQFGF